MAKFNSYKIRRWSVSVRWRDRRCKICGSKEKLEAHHIRDKSNHPGEAYDLDNGITLCGDNKKSGNACHRTFHVVFKGGYRRKCDEKDFERFRQMIRYANPFLDNSL